MYIASKKEEINTLDPENTKLNLLLAEVGRTRLVILSKERSYKGFGEELVLGGVGYRGKTRLPQSWKQGFVLVRGKGSLISALKHVH